MQASMSRCAVPAALLLLLVVLPTAASADEAPSLADLFERIEPSVVRVKQHEGGGTGFLLGSGDRVATAFHVVDRAREILVETRDGVEIPATLTAWDRKRDVALLTLETPIEGATPLRLADAPPRVGDPVWTVGQPLVEGPGPKGSLEGLLAWSLSEGLVSSVGEQQIQTTVVLQGGNSGGPLLDMQGRVLGVAISCYGAFGLAAAADALAELEQAEPRARRHVPLHFGGSLGLRLDSFPEHDKPRRGYVGLNATLDLTIDRRLVVGAGVNAGWLIHSDEETDPNPLRRSEVFAFVGPSFDLSGRPRGDGALVLQPYFMAGVLVAESGVRTWEATSLEPSCDFAAGPCPTHTSSSVDWTPSTRMLLGGGLRLLYGPAQFSVDVGTSPTRLGDDFRVGFTVGFRFGGP
jgi:hypothetical protein